LPGQLSLPGFLIRLWRNTFPGKNNAPTGVTVIHLPHIVMATRIRIASAPHRQKVIPCVYVIATVHSSRSAQTQVNAKRASSASQRMAALVVATHMEYVLPNVRASTRTVNLGVDMA